MFIQVRQNLGLSNIQMIKSYETELFHGLLKVYSNQKMQGKCIQV